MRLIAESSGGFYAGVSNDDDIVGQIMLAKSKITSEALHNVEVSIDGVRTFDVTGLSRPKVFKGQQVVLFGKYTKGGRAKLTLKAAYSGEDKVYRTEFDFPAVDTDYPEVERLWALQQVELLEQKAAVGELDPNESKSAVESIGVAYQLVTDETSMLVLTDEAFIKHGIARDNKARVAIENQARQVRVKAPIRDNRIDTSQPTFNAPAFHISTGGGGALPPVAMLGVLALLAGAGIGSRRSRD